jgi:betaine-aldehyde dehydrogenase
VDPLIVFDDADLDVAVPGAAWARLLNAGQVCTSAKRLYLAAPIAREFTERLLDYVGTLRVGDPMDPAVDVGPLISAEALATVERQIADAVRQGAQVLAGGCRIQPNGLRGHFLAPTILSDVAHGTLPTTEEIFGPVLSLTVARDADEAIRMANDSRYGLGATVYTKSLETAMRAMQEIKAGTFWINDPLTDNDAGPFGGFKQSGLGRELGQEGLEAFQETKHVHIESELAAKDWWYPYGGGGAPPHG